jgi:hypothetical protein
VRWQGKAAELRVCLDFLLHFFVKKKVEEEKLKKGVTLQTPHLSSIHKRNHNGKNHIQ